MPGDKDNSLVKSTDNDYLDLYKCKGGKRDRECIWKELWRVIDNIWDFKCKDKGRLQWCRLKMSFVPGACENSSSTLVKLKVFFCPGIVHRRDHVQSCT